MKHDYNTPGSVDAIATKSSHMGFVQAHEFGGTGFVEKVVVRADDNTNPSFNIVIDGSTLFSTDQTLTAADTPETFVPDQNRHFTGPSVQVLFSVTASASTNNDMECGVLVDDQRRH